jgi:ectoine hydroxylase-related dioxygenase (phytanoyl-CoA dioxygenase family)
MEQAERLPWDKPPLFQDPAQDAHFAEHGYVVLRNFMPAEGLARLKAHFDAYQARQPVSGFFSSSYLPDQAYKQEVQALVAEVFAPAVNRVFREVKTLGGSFLVKAPDSGSDLPMHQDWTIVDESRFAAVNIWTPLVPVTLDNGPLMAVPGSHRWQRTYRAPSIPWVYEPVKDLLLKAMIAFTTEPGDAVAIDQSLVHYSPANRTTQIRPAVTAGVVHAGAALHFHYLAPDTPDQLEVFDQSDTFLMEFTDFHQDIYARPKLGTPAGALPYSARAATPEQVLAWLGPEGVARVQAAEAAAATPRPQGLFNRVRQLLGV